MAIILVILWMFFPFWGDGFHERPNQPDIVVLKQIISTPSSWKTIALFSIAVGIETGVYSMTPLYFVSERNFSFIEANHLLSISRIPGLFMVILSGWLADRLSVSLMVRVSTQNKAACGRTYPLGFVVSD